MSEQKLIIIRGIPGSGKSTRAKFYKEQGFKHFEADMYFEISGKYIFESSKIKDAHEWCKAHVQKELEAGNSVVVSNTFIKKWEFEYYVKLAKQLGVTYTIEVMRGNYDSVHGVPFEKIKQMQENFEE
jgi:predicted kinase